MPATDPADQALAATLRRLRRRRGQTQEDLAYDAGITVAALGRIERGRSNPAWTTVMKVACALDLDLAMLEAAIEQTRQQAKPDQARRFRETDPRAAVTSANSSRAGSR